METKESFRATFERDHVHMTVTLTGAFERTDAERFKADAVTACRGRQREWTVDVRDLEFADSAFVGLLQWLRQEWGHVCVLNPSPTLRRVLEVTGADQSIVVRSDSRARA